MKRVKSALVLLLPLTLSLPVLAETAPEIASYTIPANAVKVHEGPPETPLSVETVLRGLWARPDPKYMSGYISTDSYFAVGAPTDMAHLLARDFYTVSWWGLDTTGHRSYSLYRFRRELYKNGKLYGIRREWYPNGELCSELPFNEDVLDGTVIYWNPSGQIVGQFEMKNGRGKRRLYYDDGQLQVEDELKNNLYNGQRVQFYPNGQPKYLSNFKDDSPQDISFKFNRDGSLQSVECVSGPSISFAALASLQNSTNSPRLRAQAVTWYLNKHIVSEDEYADAAAKDHHLPPYFKDISRYTAYFAAQAKVQMAKYRKQPRVIIPLLLDEKGNALPAPR